MRSPPLGDCSVERGEHAVGDGGVSAVLEVAARRRSGVADGGRESVGEKVAAEVSDGVLAVALGSRPAAEGYLSRHHAETLSLARRGLRLRCAAR